MPEKEEQIFRVKPPRRMLQVCVVLLLVAIPYLTRNPVDWSPSRIVLGHLPPPGAFPVSGDTWSFTAWGFNLLHPVAFIEQAVSSKVFYVPALLGVLIPLLLTVILGRVFCSWLCPVGFLLELNQKVNGLLKKAGIHFAMTIRDLRYTIFFLSLILVFFFAFPLISVFDPPHVFGRELMYIFTHNAISLSGAGLLLGILLFETFSTSRVWCNYLCPSGGALSLLGAKRLLNISMNKEKCVHCVKCDDVCPYYLQPMKLADGIDFDWTKCDNCGLCRDICPTDAISYTVGRERGK